MSKDGAFENVVAKIKKTAFTLVSVDSSKTSFTLKDQGSDEVIDVQVKKNG